MTIVVVVDHLQISIEAGAAPQPVATAKWGAYLDEMLPLEESQHSRMWAWLKERDEAGEPWAEVLSIEASPVVNRVSAHCKAGFRFGNRDAAVLFKLTFGGSV